MGKKGKIAIIVIALVVLAGAGFGLSKLFGGVSFAEGYLYEEENRMIYAKVTAEQDKEKVEVIDTYVETEDSVPILKTASYVYTGKLEGDKLVLVPAQQPGAPVNATVSRDELAFQGPLQAGKQVPPALSANSSAYYQEQLEAMTTRINELAEVKKKEVAEKRAKEEARVQFAKKVEKTDRLVLDLEENAKYLTDVQFADEASMFTEHASELAALLDEVKLYGEQPSVQETEYAVMKETVGAMKVLVDGIQSMEKSVKDKKQRMTDIMKVMETDLADSQATWEEIKADAPKSEERQKALDAAVKTAKESMEQAKQRMAAIDKQQTAAVQTAAKLYGEANALLAKAKGN